MAGGVCVESVIQPGPAKPPVKTIPVRIRVVVYPSPNEESGYSYCLDEYLTSEVSPDSHVVWLTAEVPVEPVMIKAEVSA